MIQRVWSHEVDTEKGGHLNLASAVVGSLEPHGRLKFLSASARSANFAGAACAPLASACELRLSELPE
jgi:hypothetical protein